jgi:hypothetical protein
MKSALGYSTDDLVGKPFQEFLHPDDIENTTIGAVHSEQKLLSFIVGYLVRAMGAIRGGWSGKEGR